MKKAPLTEKLIAFIEGNQEKFYRIAFGYMKNREDALDIVHDAVVKGIEKCYTIRESQYMETWFYRILINECIGSLRKNRKITYIEDISEFAKLISGNEKSDMNIDLYAALDKLPPKLKSVVILRFFEDMKLEEIAQITSANLSTVKSRLYKALKILKTDMED